MTDAAMGARWPSRTRRRALLRWAILVGIAAYLALALRSIDINPGRIREGLPRGAEFLSAFAHPDFALHAEDIVSGILESLAMSAVATVLGILLSIPLALGAARNVSPLPVYLSCRAALTLSRSFPELITAILFVVMVGFGPLAGVLTLALASIGFLAKLLAEQIESISPAPVEAIRATGAAGPTTLVWGVAPQVLPRLIGLSVYRLDINFRESAVIGIVGAGGIGATLRTAFDRYEHGTAAACLLLIVGLVLAGETVSGRLRGRIVGWR